jgi:hypothetical protein
LEPAEITASQRSLAELDRLDLGQLVELQRDVAEQLRQARDRYRPDDGFVGGAIGGVAVGGTFHEEVMFQVTFVETLM